MAIERCAASPAPASAAAAPATPPPSPPTHLLTLEHGEHNDSTLYRFEKGCYLQFCPGPSLLGRKVFLYTNYVVSDSQEEKAGDGADEVEFVRSQYYGLQWRGADGAAAGAGPLLADTDVRCRLRLSRAGAFHYYFVYDNAESPAGPQGSGWFHVAPRLRVPLDALMCQTVLSKCLGPLARWPAALRVAAECGYNMVHFTPVQRLGASGSCYSIADHLRLDPRYGGDWDELARLLERLRAERGVLAVCDVVLNHAATEAEWLRAQPEATYNCALCPHLRPAALLDALLARLSAQVARGEWAARGLPAALATEDQLAALRAALLDHALPEARLHELFQCDVERVVHDFCCLARNRVPREAGAGAGAGAGEGAEPLQLVADAQCRRLAAGVDLERALQLYNVYREECPDEESRLRRCCDALRRRLEELNAAAADELAPHLRAAADNVVAGARYQRLQADGPRWPAVSAERPLAPRYFTPCVPDAPDAPVAALEAALWGPPGATAMAHNGWVMDADPLQDFAAPPARARVYLRRELIAWGDSVKLRYGDKPADSPFLWEHMRRYVELTARLFDGVRLDNCHSTPLCVAEYMLDCARAVRPDLYVVAELFTNSDHVDNIFVNRLGITSLVREAQSAWDAHEQGRLVYRYGGRSVGAFLRPAGEEVGAAPRVAHAMLLDLTHDNPSPLDRRCVFDVLPCAALVAMACCATGSARGLDELVPHHVHVVDEERLYRTWAEGEAAGEGEVTAAHGVLAARRALNELHAALAAEGYDEVFVDQVDADVVAVTRHHPRTRQSVILVAFTAFRAPDPAAPDGGARTPRPLRFEGELDEILLEAELRHAGHRSGGSPVAGPGEAAAARHPRYVAGLAQYECALRRGVPLGESRAFAAQRSDGDVTELAFRALLPGAVVALRVRPRAAAATALTELGATLARGVRADLAAPLAELDAGDYNALLFRCEAEERAAGGPGVYDVPGHGPLVYAGLQGVASLLDEVVPRDDLGHALCANLRAGDWLAQYTWRRLEHEPRLAALAARYRELLRPLERLPRFLVPAYFAALLRALHAAVRAAALAHLRLPPGADEFRRALTLTSVQLLGRVPGAPLPGSDAPSMSAGLPHFAAGYMRVWGRDTFVALRGLLLLPGRWAEARAHLVAFGACLRHGLVPNLLDGGRAARYNCRDAVWWWLEALQQYARAAPDGAALLAAPVSRLFPRDDSEPQPWGAHQQPLHDVVQEALDKHFQGLVFRERNAGRAIDAHMSDKGFNVQIGIDPETGFPFGGNDANCGTWMDKMGSSERAGNRGRPATPRDGSAVELVALAYSAARWLAAEHAAGRHPYPGVLRRHADGALTSWGWAQWAARIRQAFERHFWVPPAPGAADARPDLVHRRAIYKDSHGASHAWADYQLRCNFVVAMALAPDLFDARHAWLALDQVERLLLGPLGLKTLDPADWAYRPDYDNADDGDDASVAHGFNYHQGPEWLWPLGFYLRARLAFAHENGRHARTVAAVLAALGPLLAELRASPWRGLPELSNAGGAACAHSCRSQAWSAGVVLEVLHDLDAARRARPLQD